MDNIRGAELAKRRLSLAARRLGTKDPVDAIGGLIDRSFPLPLDDPRYGKNHLAPNCVPLELSFSEMAGKTLRFDMQPGDPSAGPLTRMQEASREMRRLVHSNYGSAALHYFDRASEPWRGSGTHANTQFGAWFGMGVDPWGLQESKVYYEMRPGDLDNLPPNLQQVARVAMDALPGLEPIFTSIACNRQRGAQRIYFFHHGELKLLDLEPLMNRLGIGHQLPNLLAAAGVILGGRFALRDGCTIIGFRDTAKGVEMKLDVLVAGMPDPPPQMFDLFNMVLAERPQSQADLHRWVRAVTSDDEKSPGDIGVVSFRVLPEISTRCSIYMRPSGYNQVGRRHAAPGHMHARHDPYRV